MVNKIDAAGDLALAQLRRALPDAVFVSAHTGDGLDRLRQRMGELVEPTDIAVDVTIPYDRGDLVARVHADGRVDATEHTDERHPDQGAGAGRAGGQPARVRDVLSAASSTLSRMAKLDPFRSPQARADFIAKYDAVVADWPVDCEERDLDIEFGPHTSIVSGSESAPPLRDSSTGPPPPRLMWRPVIEALRRVIPLLLRRHDHRRQQECCEQPDPRRRNSSRGCARSFAALDIEYGTGRSACLMAAGSRPIAVARRPNS